MRARNIRLSPDWGRRWSVPSVDCRGFERIIRDHARARLDL